MAEKSVHTMAELWEARRSRLLTRRRLLQAGAVGATAGFLGPSLLRRALASDAVPVDPHLSFGPDAARQMTVSWRTAGQSTAEQSIRVLLDGHQLDTPEIDVRVVDRAPSVYSHVALTDLEPDRTYRYELLSGGAVAAASSFTTAPGEPRNFVFTALGDQGTDAVKANGVNAAVVAQGPALHFHVGDLCYAYRLGTGGDDPPTQKLFDTLASVDGVAINHGAWDAWLALISRPAGSGDGGAHRIPWMAAIGNHEMEPTYGRTGYHGATSRLAFPGNGVHTGDRRDDVTYSFDYGNVRFIALDGNDANYEIPGNKGYLGDAQTAWLESVLIDANQPGRGIDFIVVGYHQCNYCTNLLHASDGGTRRWDDLFCAYGVDLVINGHNHSYERAHPFASSIDEPARLSFPVATTVTPAEGPTFVTAGAGGNERVEQSAYELGMLSYVTGEDGVRMPEQAYWSSVRRLGPSSFLRVAVDAEAGSTTSMTVRAIEVASGVMGRDIDSFAIVRPKGGRTG